MALETDGERTPLLLAGNASREQVRVGGVEGERTSCQTVSVQDRGETILFRDSASVYDKTNFYIRQTRQYIPTRKLQVFLNFKWLIWITFLAVTVQSLILLITTFMLGRSGLDIVVTATSLGISTITLLSCVLVLIVYYQHLHVIFRTIPWVLSQPVVPNLNSGNKHLEIAVTNLESVYLSAHNRGIGLVSQSSGKVKFQVLSINTVILIKRARAVSGIFAIISTLLTLWSLALVVASLGEIPTAWDVIYGDFSGSGDYKPP